MLRYLEQNMRKRTPWRKSQAHVSLFRCSVPFLDIALQARGNDVVPSIDTAARARNDVINRQIMPFDAAVLARIGISMENVSARKANFFVRNAYVMSQPNHCWRWKIRIDHSAIVLDLFSLSLQKQDYCTSPCTYVKRFV